VASRSAKCDDATEKTRHPGWSGGRWVEVGAGVEAGDGVGWVSRSRFWIRISFSVAHMRVARPCEVNPDSVGCVAVNMRSARAVAAVKRLA
jgi:hypothetical protein